MRPPGQTPVLLFAFGIFQIEHHLYAQASLDNNPPIYASFVARMHGACHHAYFLLVGPVNFFCPAILEQLSS
jgi:hypothetical protein